MLEFHPKNPFRVLDWRWQRAGDVIEGGPPVSRRRDDPWVQRAARLRAGLAKAASKADLAVLMYRDPPAYWAYEMYRHRDDPARRVATHALEARLLATQEPADIAARGALDAAAVEVYGRLFYDVAGRHDELDYIATMALGPAVYTGLHARDYDLLWKLLGWGYGPALVDLMLTTVPQRMRIVDPEAALAAVVDDAAASLKIKGMVAAKTLHLNSFNVTQVLQLYVQLVDIEAKGGKDAGTQQTIMTNVQAMMGVLPFRVAGSPPPEAVSDRPMALALTAYDGSAAELRGDELMDLGAGRAIAFDPAGAASPFRPPAPAAPRPA